MKTLVLNKRHKFVEDIFTNINNIITTYGKSFNVQFENKTIPLIIKRKIEENNDSKNYIYSISIAYPKRPPMNYHTLYMLVGANRYPTTAQIINVNKNTEYKLSGGYIVRFAIAFLRQIGVKKIFLRDLATASIDSNIPCTVSLSPYLLLKKATTFYGKYGFKPMLDDEIDTSYETTEAMLKRLCKIVIKLQKTKISTIITAISSIKDKLEKPENIDKSELCIYEHHFQIGVDERKCFYPQPEHIIPIVKNMSVFISAFQVYENDTITSMIEKCTCREYKLLYDLLTKFPSKIKVGKKIFINVYREMFEELLYIHNNSIYYLDLTKSADSSTC